MLYNTLLLLKDNFIIKGVKDISFALDKLVYSLASSAYKVFLIIGNIRLTGGGIMSKIMVRLYGVISLFMIFVLAYNLLLYIIDPDKLTDSKAGGTAILKKIIIALVIIVASPTAFDTLYDTCQKVLEARVVENIVLGGYAVSGNSNTNGASQNYDASKKMIVDVYTAFLYPNPTEDSVYTSSDCVENSGNDYCEAYLAAIDKESLDPFESLVDASKAGNTIHYSFFISTIGGVILFLFLLGYAINLAMRAGKLAVLEMIAPIPALMDLIPNKAGATERWIKAVLSTFAQVFIYQATIFFIVWLIGLVPEALNGAFEGVFNSTNGNGTVVTLFAKIIIIFGLLKVGKELPKFIGDILGIKMEGASVGGVLKGALGLGAGIAGTGLLAAGVLRGGVKNAVSGFSNVRKGNGLLNNAKAIGAASLSTVAGLGSGFARNVWGARNVKSFSDARKLYSKTNADVQAKRATREAYKNLHGGSFWGAQLGHVTDIGHGIASGFQDYTGLSSEYARQKAQDEALTKFNSIYNDGIASIWKNDSTWSYYNQLLDRAKAEGGNVEINGKTYSSDDIKTIMKKRQAVLTNKSSSQEKIRDTLIQLQAFSSAHQGTSGIPDMKLFETGGAFDINQTSQYSVAQIGGWEASKGEAVLDDDGNPMYTATLDGAIAASRGELTSLQNNATYVANKARDKQEIARKQAMEEARKNANKKNSDK